MGSMVSSARGAPAAAGAPAAGRGRQERLHGDIGEGVSALLSLASVPGQEAPTSQGEVPGGSGQPGQQLVGHGQQQQYGGPPQHPMYPGNSRGEVKRDKAGRRAVRDTGNDQELAQQRAHPLQQPSSRPCNSSNLAQPSIVSSAATHLPLSSSPAATDAPPSSNLAPSPKYARRIVVFA